MSEDAKELLRIDNLTVERGVHRSGGGGMALRNVSLTVDRGEIVLITGEKGCGISLLCRLIMGVTSRGIKVTGGDLLAEGCPLSAMKRRERRLLRTREFACIGERAELSWNPALTVDASLREASRRAGGGIRAVHPDGKAGSNFWQEDWSDLFHAVGIVEPELLLARQMGELSALMVRRLSLMRALRSGARLLVCDGTVAGLDRVAEREWLELLLQLREERGLAVLLSTARLRGGSRFADRMALFFQGGILETGTPEELARSPRFLYTKEFLASAPRLSRRPRELPAVSSEAVLEAEAAVGSSS